MRRERLTTTDRVAAKLVTTAREIHGHDYHSTRDAPRIGVIVEGIARQLHKQGLHPIALDSQDGLDALSAVAIAMRAAILKAPVQNATKISAFSSGAVGLSVEWRHVIDAAIRQVYAT
jgi:hypothetical protein